MQNDMTSYTVQVLEDTWSNGTQIWSDCYTNLSKAGANKYMETARILNVGKPVRVIVVQPLNGLELA